MKRVIMMCLTLVLAAPLIGFSKEKPQSERFSLHTTNETSFISYYSALLHDNDRVLMTSDLMFYAEHLLLDYTLFYIEEKTLRVELDALLDYMIEGVKKRMQETKRENLIESYTTALSYLLVSKRCLYEDYPIIKAAEGRVQTELSKIENHSGFEESSIFSKKEDFSQYIPRGHYTRTENLMKYFKAMMYLMRMRFEVETKANSVNSELKAALIIASVMNESPKAQHHYKKINDAVSILLPREDDLMLTELADSIGEKLTDDFLCDEDKVSEAAKIAVNLSHSKIISDYKKDNELQKTTVGFMGQRYIFDSEVFQNLVYDKVTSYQGKSSPFTLYGGMRTMPRGLDLMYVLGSGKAYEILEDEGDVQYLGYSDNVVIMKKKAKELSKESFYNRMLLQFGEVIKERKESSPPFMLDEKFQLKELNSLLAAWSALRHDVILYAKQSYTVKITSAPPKEKTKTKVIAESYSKLYETMRSDVENLTDRLYAIFKDEWIKEAGESFEKLCELYNEISYLTMKQTFYEDNAKVRMTLLDFDIAVKNLLVNQKEREDNMAIVSDVHTDSNSEMVLQESVGSVLKMNADFGGEIFTGGAMSYYEFKKPISQRMTDEEWRDYLKTGDASELLFRWQKRIYDYTDRGRV
ncbi:MAG: DUF3160 domain-containing protein [bacterium]|nr:DUF3160 domain-containing protein [bacterium]